MTQTNEKFLVLSKDFCIIMRIILLSQNHNNNLCSPSPNEDPMLSRLKNVTIGVVLFSGFTLINYLSSDNALFLISVDVQSFFKKYWFLCFAAIIIIYVIQQLWRDLPNPVSMAEVHEFRPIIKQYLEGAINDYATVIHGMKVEIPTFRMNVMLKVRNNSFARPKLKIACSLGCTPEQNNNNLLELKLNEPCYSRDEENMLWEKGQGACGAAYKTSDVTIFDPTNTKFSGVSKRLNNRQKDISRDLKSIISLPLLLHGRVIGVLNVDSTENITQTKFDDFGVCKILDDYADSLSKICAIFIDGIRIVE